MKIENLIKTVELTRLGFEMFLLVAEYFHGEREIKKPMRLFHFE